MKQNQFVKDELLFVSIKPDRLHELEEDETGAVLEVCATQIVQCTVQTFV